MIIKIIDVDQQTAKSKAGKPYDLLEVSYKNMTFQEKAESKKIFPFGSKEVFDTLKKASKGQTFSILREKDDAGYWQWVGIQEGEVQMEVADKGAPAKAGVGVPVKSTFETPDERAKKQVYIIKQSCIGYAIETLKTDKKAPTVDEVLTTAQLYVDWVMGVNLDAEPVPQGLPDDVPY